MRRFFPIKIKRIPCAGCTRFERGVYAFRARELLTNEKRKPILVYKISDLFKRQRIEPWARGVKRSMPTETIRKNQIWKMWGRDCKDLATELLIRENGLDRSEKKYQRMLQKAMATGEGLFDGVELRSVYSYYPDFYLRDAVLAVDGKAFVSPAFRNIDPAQVEGVYVFALTAGDFADDSLPMMEQVLRDLWGTAFATAARQNLQAHFAAAGRISEVFGPGLYGLPMEAMQDVMALLPIEEIGMTVNESGFLWPVKSYGGFYFRVAEDYKPLGAACAKCRGSKLSCHMCEYNPQNRDSANIDTKNGEQ